MSNESKTPRTDGLVAGMMVNVEDQPKFQKVIIHAKDMELELTTLKSRIEQSMSDRAKGLLHEKELLGRIERLTKAGDELYGVSFSCGCNSCLIARAKWQEAKK